MDVTDIKGSGPCSFAQAQGLSRGEVRDGVLQGIFSVIEGYKSLVCYHPVIFTRIYLVELVQLAVCWDICLFLIICVIAIYNYNINLKVQLIVNT